MVTFLADDLATHHGLINVGIVRRGDRAMLIDCGDGQVIPALQAMGVRHVERVLFTHHHRDQASGLPAIFDYSASPVRVTAPASEGDCFASVERYWTDPARQWHLYDFHPHHLMLPESVPVDAACREGDQIEWGRWRIRVLETPGHTDGSVSYLVEGAAQRVIFSGDVIYAPGQIWAVFPLQRGGRFGEWTIRDYHGFLGARSLLTESLQKIRQARPSALVPSHGTIMNLPEAAIDALLANLRECVECYAEISALHYHFPEMFQDDRIRRLIDADTAPLPPFVRHLGTTFVVVAADGAALVMDCGSPRVIEEIQALQEAGIVRQVELFWVSHYHDDHVDAAADFQRRFPCPTVADATVADVISHPSAYRLPCLSPTVVRVDRRTRSGESWDWHEFRLTAYHFPGQTYYHGALLVEGHGQRLFFIGDSFTPSGIDDYCAGNRNFLGPDRGFDACLRLLDELCPDYLFNCHVDVAFRFSAEQIRFMRENLTRRAELFQRLLPWDDPNYGLDEHWVRCQPYAQVVRPGQSAPLEVVITNHSTEARLASCQPALPPGWSAVVPAPTLAPARGERALKITIQPPGDARPGQYVIPIALEYAGRRLGQLSEALIRVLSVSGEA